MTEKNKTGTELSIYFGDLVQKVKELNEELKKQHKKIILKNLLERIKGENKNEK